MLRVPFEVVTDKFRPFYCSLLFIATFTIRWQHCLLSMYLVTDQCYLKYVAVGMPSNALLMNFFFLFFSLSLLYVSLFPQPFIQCFHHLSLSIFHFLFFFIVMSLIAFHQPGASFLLSNKTLFLTQLRNFFSS